MKGSGKALLRHCPVQKQYHYKVHISWVLLTDVITIYILNYFGNTLKSLVQNTIFLFLPISKKQRICLLMLGTLYLSKLTRNRGAQNGLILQSSNHSAGNFVFGLITMLAGLCFWSVTSLHSFNASRFY